MLNFAINLPICLKKRGKLKELTKKYLQNIRKNRRRRGLIE